MSHITSGARRPCRAWYACRWRGGEQSLVGLYVARRRAEPGGPVRGEVASRAWWACTWRGGEQSLVGLYVARWRAGPGGPVRGEAASRAWWACTWRGGEQSLVSLYVARRRAEPGGPVRGEAASRAWWACTWRGGEQGLADALQSYQSCVSKLASAGFNESVQPLYISPRSISISTLYRQFIQRDIINAD